jgi:hypothetical protein
VIIYYQDQKRKRDFIERKLSSMDESRDEQRTNLGKDDLRRGNTEWSVVVVVVNKDDWLLQGELLVRRIAEIERSMEEKKKIFWNN